MTVEVLLGTYNSSKYLSEQLDSLFNQTRQDFRILVRDDGSTDSTPELLKEAHRAHPEKIVLLSSSGNGGFLANFGALLEAATADCLLFCDHDDVWLPEKIEKTVKVMEELTEKYGNDVPLCVHCDAILCDGALNPVHPSVHAAWKVGSTPEKSGFPVNIPIFGWSMAINRKLRDLALPLTPECSSHDTWCGRVAWYLGKVAFIPEPLLKYRVHTGNLSCGSRQRYPQVLFQHLQNFRLSCRKLFNNLVIPTALFARRYEKRLSESDRKRLQVFGRWGQYGFLKRICLLLRCRLYAEGALRTIGLLFLQDGAAQK